MALLAIRLSSPRGTCQAIPLSAQNPRWNSFLTIIRDIIDDVRIVKSNYEIGRNVHACQVVELGHEKLLEDCHPGTLVGSLYAASSGAMMARILADIPHANLMVTRAVGAVWPPSLSHDPHIIPTFDTQMEEAGPHVTIAFCQVDGYGVEL